MFPDETQELSQELQNQKENNTEKLQGQPPNRNQNPFSDNYSGA